MKNTNDNYDKRICGQKGGGELPDHRQKNSTPISILDFGLFERRVVNERCHEAA